jgi:hypothetical protein
LQHLPVLQTVFTGDDVLGFPQRDIRFEDFSFRTLGQARQRYFDALNGIQVAGLNGLQQRFSLGLEVPEVGLGGKLLGESGWLHNQLPMRLAKDQRLYLGKPSRHPRQRTVGANHKPGGIAGTARRERLCRSIRPDYVQGVGSLGDTVPELNLVPVVGEITLGQFDVLRVGHGLPEGDGFLRETAIGEGDDKRGARLEDAVDPAKGIEGAGHVLDRDSTGDRVEDLILKRQAGLVIQVVHDPLVQLGIVRHFFGVHPQADDALGIQVERQMGAPAAHQVEIYPTQVKVFSQKTSQRCNSLVVDMDDFAWLAIKEGVVALVGPLKTLIGEVLRIYQLNSSEMRYWYWQSAGASQRNPSVSASAGPGQQHRTP